MITLNFQINPAYLAYHMIVNCSSTRFFNGVPDEKIVKFQNAAWSNDKVAYDFLRFGINDINLIGSPTIREVANRAERLLQVMVADTTFAPLLDETTRSLELVRSEWESNCSKTQDVISEITGLVLNGDFPVFITHPALKQGHYLGEVKGISWTYRNVWSNYNTVYIWHELLHSFIPGADLEHAVIQLITDNELRVRLNGGSYPPFEGHAYLSKLMELLLPSWQRYLQNKENRKINSFITEMASVPEIKEESEVCTKQRNDRSDDGTQRLRD